MQYVIQIKKFFNTVTVVPWTMVIISSQITSRQRTRAFGLSRDKPIHSYPPSSFLPSSLAFPTPDSIIFNRPTSDIPPATSFTYQLLYVRQTTLITWVIQSHNAPLVFALTIIPNLIARRNVTVSSLTRYYCPGVTHRRSN